jgi:hypothetical protein
MKNEKEVRQQSACETSSETIAARLKKEERRRGTACAMRQFERKLAYYI